METQFTPVQNLTYAEATRELDDIIRNMQSDQCDIDSLTAYTRRATELIAECRRRLTRTDKELQEILSNLQ